jgi:hypothetical protein
VIVHPADEPHGDVVVAVQLDVGARVGAVADQVTPGLWAGGDVGDQGAQLGLVEVVGGGVDHPVATYITFSTELVKMKGIGQPAWKSGQRDDIEAAASLFGAS